MPTFMSSVERAHRSAGSAAEKRALPNRLRKSERGMLRMGSKKSEQWKRSPTEGLYQVVVSEVREDGRTHPLERGGGRAFAVTSVLDLGLRMLESPRGRSALEGLARKAICVWQERPDPGPVYEPSSVNVPAAVDEFLRCVRYRFPGVKLDDRNGFCHEEENNTVSEPWFGDEYSTLERFTFDPKTAAVLHLNWHLVEKLYWTRLKADVAQRQHRVDEQMAQIARFHRLQFHLAAMVTHHLCHLFVNFLRQFENLAHEVTDADLLRLVSRYDPGAEFEVDFFGGRPKLFIDHPGPREQSYSGQSYVIRRGLNGSRMAALVAQYRIESYLRGDFSVPLLTEVEGDLLTMERYQDVKRRHGASKRESCPWREGRTGTRRAVEIGSSGEQPLSLPWDVLGEEYQMLKRACFEPAIQLVDVRWF